MTLAIYITNALNAFGFFSSMTILMIIVVSATDTEDALLGRSDGVDQLGVNHERSYEVVATALVNDIATSTDVDRALAVFWGPFRVL